MKSMANQSINMLFANMMKKSPDILNYPCIFASHVWINVVLLDMFQLVSYLTSHENSHITYFAMKLFPIALGDDTRCVLRSSIHRMQLLSRKDAQCCLKAGRLSLYWRLSWTHKVVLHSTWPQTLCPIGRDGARFLRGPSWSEALKLTKLRTRTTACVGERLLWGIARDT